MYPKIKTVNVDARIPVNTVTPKISGYVAGVTMTTADILKCIIRKAMVDEILPNGKLLRLNMQNYYTDNRAGLEVTEAPMKVSAFMARTSTVDIVSEVPEAVEVVVEDAPEVVETVVEETVDVVVEDASEIVESVVEESVETVDVVVEDAPEVVESVVEDTAEAVNTDATAETPKPTTNNFQSKKRK